MGLKRKPPKQFTSSVEEIPEARRDLRHARQSPALSLPIALGLGLGAIALLLTALFLNPLSPPTTPSPAEPIAEETSQPQSNTTEPKTTVNDSDDEGEAENILGHLPYPEAPASALKAVSGDGRIRLRTAAAEKFLAMQAAAKADGVELLPLSGFRSVAEQEYLFFEIKAQRGQVASKRAEVSAPPGYSEHHTGYAIDIGDARDPATNLLESFENTATFAWLQENAAYYSFELSFPRNNPQGISYEPWHWRFVGDRDSLETFYKAKSLQSHLLAN